MQLCWERIADAAPFSPIRYPDWVVLSETHLYAYMGDTNSIDRWEFPSLANQQRVYTYLSGDEPDRTWSPMMTYLNGKLWWNRLAHHPAGGGSTYQSILEGGDVSSLPITSPTVLYAASQTPYEYVPSLVGNTVTGTVFALRDRRIFGSNYVSELIEIDPQTTSVEVRASSLYNTTYQASSGRVFLQEANFAADNVGGVWFSSWDTQPPYKGLICRYDPQDQSFLLSPYVTESYSGPQFFIGTDRGSVLYLDSFAGGPTRYDDAAFEMFFDRSKLNAPEGPFLQVRRNCLTVRYPLSDFLSGAVNWEVWGAAFGDGPAMALPDFSEIYWVQQRYIYPNTVNYVARLTGHDDPIPGGAGPVSAGDLSAWGLGWTSGALPL